ncbi:hypothetical protein [Paraburkholderia sp. HP33-1]|uniref:hypothetical protein n=1 Tax=Paraburkholderia sp. HP33-1 TaxID=2883243 RepID=UPI001F29BADE|nr:hypothetical protein [Paraburkholderia sp. HP33-1]
MRELQIVQLTYPKGAVDKQGKTFGQPVQRFTTSTCSKLNDSSVLLAGLGRQRFYEPSYHFPSALTLQEIIQLSTAFSKPAYEYYACIRKVSENLKGCAREKS